VIDTDSDELPAEEAGAMSWSITMMRAVARIASGEFEDTGSRAQLLNELEHVVDQTPDGVREVVAMGEITDLMKMFDAAYSETGIADFPRSGVKRDNFVNFGRKALVGGNSSRLRRVRANDGAKDGLLMIGTGFAKADFSEMSRGIDLLMENIADIPESSAERARCDGRTGQRFPHAVRAMAQTAGSRCGDHLADQGRTGNYRPVRTGQQGVRAKHARRVLLHPC
jgi:hypothetical protein